MMTRSDNSTRLNKLLGHVVISQGGVVPFINPEVSISIFTQPELFTHRAYSCSPASQRRARRIHRRCRRHFYSCPLSVLAYCIIYSLCTFSYLYFIFCNATIYAFLHVCQSRNVRNKLGKKEVVGLFGIIQLARDRVFKRVVLVAYFG